MRGNQIVAYLLRIEGVLWMVAAILAWMRSDTLRDSQAAYIIWTVVGLVLLLNSVCCVVLAIREFFGLRVKR